MNTQNVLLQMCSEVGIIKGTCVKVDAYDLKPVYLRLYRFNVNQKANLIGHIKILLQNKTLEPSESDWNHPILLVPKANSTATRLVMDLRKFNARILENKKITRFPMPTLNEIIDTVSSANPQLFSAYDLTNAFLQCNLDPKSRDYFSFSTHLGNFRYTKMVYGYTQSPSIFQAEMNRILNGLL